ncbi:purine-nucleoside phosphorylase [Lacihabitans lacunae]|uniref:Purine nucleoside phosphorylase n=1 Tax=Lacihabitans lacunae TaxID=1028214 RepID=A0ABV7YQ45_9BACT
MLDQIKETYDFLRNQIGDFQPAVGIVLGTGLGKLVDDIEIQYEVSYEDIPNFVKPTVEFHSGRLLFGILGDKKVVCMQGRFHFYEGYTMKEITFPVRVMKQLGIETLVISNAAGGLNPEFNVSDIMIIEDHISLLLPSNPLLGENIMGDRFPDMSEPYTKGMITRAFEIAKEHNLKGIVKGTYVSVTGPQLETKAEYKMLRNFGADAVGMSTVPEVIVARQMNIPVFGISVITDLCDPENLEVADINKIIAAAGKAEPTMTFLIKEIVKG